MSKNEKADVVTMTETLRYARGEKREEWIARG